MKSPSFSRYLLNHVKRSSDAMRLLDDVLCQKDRDACVSLYDEFEAEREVIGTILADLGTSELEIHQGMVDFSPRLERPSRFESLEKLAIAVQGKRILWELLDEMKPSVTTWSAMDFKSLKHQAEAQRNKVEEWLSEAVTREMMECGAGAAVITAA